MSLAKKVACPVVALILILILAMPVSASSGAIAKRSGGPAAGSVSWIDWALGGRAGDGFTARLFGWLSAQVSTIQTGAGPSPGGQTASGTDPVVWPAATTDLDRGAGIDPEGGH